MVAMVFAYKVLSGNKVPQPPPIPLLPKSEKETSLNTIVSTSPMGAATKRYKQEHFTTLNGTQLTYYWLPPNNREKAPLPLTIILHDASGRANAGEYLAGAGMQKAYPSYVVVPVIGKPPIWAHPDTKYADYENLGYIEELIGELMQAYPIDRNRIYIIGCSMGGMGTFGAISRYPDLFAAGIAIAGQWNIIDAPIMKNTPLLVIHGDQDKSMPVEDTRELVKTIEDNGGTRIVYREVENIGHTCSDPRFYILPIWKWLFSQSKTRSP